MANKIKQAEVFRSTAVKGMLELYALANNAVQDESLRTLFQMRYKDINSIREEFTEHHRTMLQLLAVQEGANIEAEQNIHSQFESKYYSIQAIYHDLFKNRSEQAPQSPLKSNIKLPKINIPRFYGDITTWPTFIGLYDSLIHKNTSLSNSEKFQYLLSFLDKEPLLLIKNIVVTDINYIVAYESLYKRYQNHRLLATHYWDKITDTPKLTTDSPRSLRYLIDTFTDNIGALKNLNYPVDSWDFILFRSLIKKLDSETVKRFELQNSSSDNPTYQELVEFLLKQCDALDSVALSNKNKTSTFNKYSPVHKVNSASSSLMVNTHTHVTQCSLCKANHLIYKCPTLVSKSPKERYDLVKQKNWCTNCLGSKHTVKNCDSSYTCRICKHKHHTLLHFDKESLIPHAVASAVPVASVSENTNLSQNTFCQPSTSQINSLTNVIPTNTTVLLSTAQIEVMNSRGYFETVRVLLDSASQANFITEKCANRLGLPRSYKTLSVHGLGQMGCSVTAGITCSIRPRDQSSQVLALEVAVLPKICFDMPSVTLNVANNWKHISNLNLADPNFNVPSSIDMLLGADVFSMILKDGRIVGNINEPTAINTIFGWILMGKVNNNPSLTINSFLSVCDSPLDSTLKRFWELETIPDQNITSPDDLLCETIYKNSYSRNSAGRFTVSLPFRDTEPSFSDSRSLALRRFFSLERRLLKNLSLYKQYCSFMQDYIDCGHMTSISQKNLTLSSNNVYYIPHHCILKPGSSTTKLRVVFDASAKSPQSLNDHLLTGPKLQQDIVSILMNFRLYKFVLTADIKQMYRQILIAESHRKYQRIIWRFSPDEPIKDFSLNTVTYGVSSAPFLAIKSILQLAEEEKDKYPLASAILSKYTYVDDVVCGCNSINEGIELRNQLICLLQSGGFELRKWASNSSDLLQDIPAQDCQTNSLSFDDDMSIKILGFKWSPSLDTFSYEVSPLDRPCTKRTILSELARIFDPLGFLTPLTFLAKYLIQLLWSLGLEWDQAPPSDVLKLWVRYKTELPVISNLSIPRHIVPTNFLKCELHAFSDSSEKGYAAVVYFRFVLPDEKYVVRLICGKSKVAPLKTISLPRLELCAAVLLSNLVNLVQRFHSDRLLFSYIFAWTDSMVVLSWIKSSPHKWKTFISNRVSYIQERIAPHYWYHVVSKENPADCSSRGLFPSELLNHPLWWSGPSWLYTSQENWPPVQSTPTETHEEKKVTVTSLFVSLDGVDSVLERFSSLAKIQRIFAYVLRFIHNCKNISPKGVASCTEIELHEALLLLVKRVQHIEFSKEISNLENNLPLTKSFRKLNPFIGEDGVLRVGGRLYFSGLSYDHKYPAILPRNHRLTELIIEYTHSQNLHVGLQTLHFLLSQKFWILSPRRTIRHVLSKCIKCFRAKPTSQIPYMGDLPSQRVTQLKPFQCVGVDYAGPFSISLSKHRGVKTQKAYLCLFVCFATKALHLELASDLSSESFIAALRRFIARRGRCNQIFSDCGSNFVGAQREISQYMQNAVETEKIQWSFNPPSAPHFGGLWESGVKAVKSHITRVVGAQVLTYEEFYTLLVQIEAILNSRPLCPLSSDPSDLSVLTPGHFLTLEPLNSLPDPDLTTLNISRLNRWQLVQRMQQDFWRRWQNEYLHTLQQRNKWTTDAPPIKEGALVLIKNELVPPLHWRLARVNKTHPGHDGIIRTLTLKTTQGVLQRPVVKVCPLPLE